MELAGFGPELAATVAAIQGLLIHGEALAYYGLPEPEAFSRTTLTVRDRLIAVLAIRESSLAEPRPPVERSLGTCRDYAQLVCAALRSQGFPARLRCGFAIYLGEARWEDHWLCEIWATKTGRWRRIDAQLDVVLRQALSVTFDPTDVPEHLFITADKAWRSCRSGERNPTDFGHGAACGLWFLRANVMRDHLALNDTVTSEWDSWRSAVGSHETLCTAEIALADQIAAWPEAAVQSWPPPPWLEDSHESRADK